MTIPWWHHRNVYMRVLIIAPATFGEKPGQEVKFANEPNL